MCSEDTLLNPFWYSLLVECIVLRSPAYSNERREMMGVGGCLFQAHHKSHHPLKGPFPVDQRRAQGHKTRWEMQIKDGKEEASYQTCVCACLPVCLRGRSQEELTAGGSRGLKPDPENNQKDRGIFWSPEVRAGVFPTHRSLWTVSLLMENLLKYSTVPLLTSPLLHPLITDNEHFT